MTNPSRSLESGVELPFQFSFRGDLVGEMCIDDAFVTLPKGEKAAFEMGLLYGKVFDEAARRDPIGFVSRMLNRRAGLPPSKRFVMGFVIFRGQAASTFYFQDETKLRVPVEMYGPLAGLYTKLEALLRERGMSADAVRAKLYPTPIAEDSTHAGHISRWVIGYESGTGKCAIFNSDHAGAAAVSEFMKGTLDFPSFDVMAVNSVAK